MGQGSQGWGDLSQAGRSHPRVFPSLPSAGGFEQSLTSTKTSDQAVAGALLLSAFPLLEGKQPLPQELVQGLCRDIPSQAWHARAPGVGVGQLEPGVTPGHCSTSVTGGSENRLRKETLSVCRWDWDGFGMSRERGCVFLAGLNESALFSCDAHNSKGLTASSPGQVNIKGKPPLPVQPQVSTHPSTHPSKDEGDPAFNPMAEIQRDLVVTWSSRFGHPSTGMGKVAPKSKFESTTVSFKEDSEGLHHSFPSFTTRVVLHRNFP